MRSVSEATSRVVEQNCSKKYIALGRIARQWEEIIGKDLAAMAQPAKLIYSKRPGKDTPEAVLEISTTSAHATTLHYRKDLILEKINRLFGAGWITGIKFTARPATPGKKGRLKKAPSRPVNPAEKAALQSALAGVEDEDIKIRLEKLGEAVINTGK
ncbi:MAG: DciA family protein [Alphaproteobacteria bacterium]|nr:DciA family protein [Alphaproteobacteria bacterium]